MTRRGNSHRSMAALFLLASWGCGSDSGPNSATGAAPPPSSGGSGVATPTPFSVSPIDPSAILWITPLGNLNPPDHTLPSDHIYFYWQDPNGPTTAAKPVFAPGAGTVTWILQKPNGDAKVEVQVTPKIQYYLDHVIVNPSVKVGSVLTPGQSVGSLSSSAFALDLGVINGDVTLSGFAKPARYGTQTLHADGPIKYFAEPLRSDLYAKVKRQGSEKDGKIDFDLPGHLVGGWFLQGLPVDQSFASSAWPKQLAFVYDTYDPTAIRIAVGGTLSLTGKFSVPGGSPDPATITPSQGLISYSLWQGAFKGTMLVEMLDGSTIRVETFDAMAVSPAFDGNSKVYTR